MNRLTPSPLTLKSLCLEGPSNTTGISHERRTAELPSEELDLDYTIGIIREIIQNYGVSLEIATFTLNFVRNKTAFDALVLVLSSGIFISKGVAIHVPEESASIPNLVELLRAIRSGRVKHTLLVFHGRSLTKIDPQIFHDEVRLPVTLDSFYPRQIDVCVCTHYERNVVPLFTDKGNDYTIFECQKGDRYCMVTSKRPFQLCLPEIFFVSRYYRHGHLTPEDSLIFARLIPPQLQREQYTVPALVRHPHTITALEIADCSVSDTAFLNRLAVLTTNYPGLRSLSIGLSLEARRRSQPTFLNRLFKGLCESKNLESFELSCPKIAMKADALCRLVLQKPGRLSNLRFNIGNILMGSMNYYNPAFRVCSLDLLQNRSIKCMTMASSVRRAQHTADRKGEYVSERLNCQVHRQNFVAILRFSAVRNIIDPESILPWWAIGEEVLYQRSKWLSRNNLADLEPESETSVRTIEVELSRPWDGSKPDTQVLNVLYICIRNMIVTPLY